MSQEPSVGRIVHYYTDLPKDELNNVSQGPYAAIITGVTGLYVVDLTVFSPNLAPVTVKNIAHDQSEGAPDFAALPMARCWKWPPRV